MPVVTGSRVKSHPDPDPHPDPHPDPSARAPRAWPCAQVPPHTIVAYAVAKTFDFTSMSLEALQRFEVPLDFPMHAVTQIHGKPAHAPTLASKAQAPNTPTGPRSKPSHQRATLQTRAPPRRVGLAPLTTPDGLHT